MRIALVTTELPGASPVPSGGLGQYVQRLALALDHAGHAVEVFTPADPGAVLPSWAHGVRRAWPSLAVWASRVTLHRLALPLDCLIQSHALNAALAARHAQERFDVVQYAHLGATALACPRGLPAVIRLSGWQPLWRAAGDGTVGGVQAHLTYRLEVAALRRASRIYAPSRHIAAVVAAATGRNIEVVDNPFALECAPSTGPSPVEGRYLLTCGAISRLKGAEVIARAAPAILAAHPDLRWVLAGREIAPGCVAAIRSAVPGGADRIIHLPHLPHPELYRLMQGAVAVVLPSLVDNLPNTCLEAMALGACVVGTHPTGMEQVIEDGVSGYLAPAGDAPGLARSVRQALGADDDVRRLIGAQAQARMERMRPEAVLPRLLTLYDCTQSAHRLERRDHAWR